MPVDELAARRNAKIAVMLCGLLSEQTADDAELRRNLLAMADEPLIARQLVLIISLDDALRERFGDVLGAAELTMSTPASRVRIASGELGAVDFHLRSADEKFAAPSR